MSHSPARNAPDSPIGEINTTPLIDVMLVLLIMFVITIPVASNTVEINLPRESGIAVDRTVNTVVIETGGNILWNGKQVEKEELTGLLVQSTLIEPEPQLHFEPVAQAPYGLTAEILWLIKQSGVTNFGFVGNERFREFSSAQ